MPELFLQGACRSAVWIFGKGQRDVEAMPLGSGLCIILRQERGHPCMRALLVLSRALPFGKASVAVVVVLCANGLRHQSIRAGPFWKETSASIRTDTKSINSLNK
ncbi:unnamed protein product [Prunus armeniaca]|uniref:Uncharacterized protein n=1 Tax=Prunus armeniaca TaxID=36596 RepID=A0A6J5W6B4_PRUAR|nr:unnamed protein product [Prunus armeniaca]